MRKAKQIFDKIIEFLIMIIMIAMSVIVLWQVITRFIYGDPSAWTEEIAKYLMVWIGFLAGAMGLKYGNHLGITLLSEMIHNATGKKVIACLITLLCLAVGVVILVYGWQFMATGAKKVASAFPIPMNYIYAAVPLSGLVVILNCVENLVKIIRGDIETTEG